VCVFLSSDNEDLTENIRAMYPTKRAEIQNVVPLQRKFLKNLKKEIK
jgi:hypothetical protein